MPSSAGPSIISAPAGGARRPARRALVGGALHLLAGPVGELAALYGGSFSLRVAGCARVGALAGVGAFLGWLGAQLSVSLSLRKFD
jgi:cell division transport system permease protein